MPWIDKKPLTRLLRQHALALWLFVLGLLGVLRFLMRAFREDAVVDAVAWTYLVGGLLLALWGAWAWRRSSPPSTS